MNGLPFLMCYRRPPNAALRPVVFASSLCSVDDLTAQTDVLLGDITARDVTIDSLEQAYVHP